MIIGLFGKSGSGKTTACDFFRKKDFFIINADEIGRELLKKGSYALSMVIKEFGEEYLDASGELNRKKLGSLVFSDENQLKKLNSITKPLIVEEVISLIKKHENAVVDGEILHNTRVVDYCDLTILLRSKNSVKHIIKRDKLSENDAINRLNSQIIPENMDIIIDNDGSIEELYLKLEGELHGKEASI